MNLIELALNTTWFMERNNYDDFPISIAFDKELRDKAFKTAKIRNMIDTKAILLQYLTIFCDKKMSGSGIENETMWNKGLARKLQSQLFENLKNKKICSPLIEHILGADVTDW